MSSQPHAPSRPPPHPPRKLGDRIFYALLVVCALLLLADAVYEKHSHFEYEDWFGFQAMMGFAAYVAIVNGAKLLRRWVKRPEDYYDE